MAWCAPCQRYLTPGALAEDGSCPACGGAVEHRAPASGKAGGGSGPAVSPPAAVSAPEGAGASAASEHDRVPWHFWLLVVAAVVYLGWRAVQGVALLL